MVDPAKPYKSRAWLYRQYYVNRMTEQQIADKAKTDQSTINRWLRKFNLKK